MNDKRALGLSCFSAILCLGLIGLYDKAGAEWVVWNWGVWVLWAAIFVAGYGLWIARAHLRQMPLLDRRGVIAALLFSVLLHVHFPHQFKILSDELVLVGVSKTIHEERQPVTPSALQDVGGATKIGSGFLDKRPFLFPLLVSVMHDLTGYRAANAIIFNALLTPVFLYLIFLAAWWITREPIAGLVAMAMVSGVPLFAHNATGGGFELLNLCLILLLFLWGFAYAREGDPTLQLGFVSTAVLLAYARYESVMYLSVAVIVVLAVWWRHRRVSLHPLTALTPLLVIPVGCIFRVVAANSAQWFQLKDKGSATAFAWSYLPKNIPNALKFFFDDEHFLLGSRWVSGACVVGVLFAILAGRKAIWRDRRSFSFWSPLTVAGVVAVNFLILLCYHWGQLDDYLVSRLSIPFYVLVILLTVYAASAAPKPKLALGFLGLVGAYSIYAVEIPTASKNHLGVSYRAGRELEAVQSFLHDNKNPDKLVLTDRPLFWTCYGVWAQDLRVAVANRRMVEDWIRVGRYSKIYVVQTFSLDADSGRLLIHEKHVTPVEWKLTEVARRRTFDGDVTVISEIGLSPEDLAKPIWRADEKPAAIGVIPSGSKADAKLQLGTETKTGPATTH